MIFQKLRNSLFIKKSLRNKRIGRLKTRRRVLLKLRPIKSLFLSMSGMLKKRGKKKLELRILIPLF